MSAFDLVKDEMVRMSDRLLPEDPLRRVALVVEEAGEAIKEALDYTRIPRTNPSISVIVHRARIRIELAQTAAMAIRVLEAMLTEERG